MVLDQALINQIRNDTYLLQIRNVANNIPNISDLTVELNETIMDIYQYFELSHFNGELVIFCASESAFLALPEPEKIHFNKNILISLQPKTILIQKMNNELLLWKNVNIKSILKNKDILFYHYKNRSESYYVNNQKILIESLPGKHSYFSSYYFLLEEALRNYSIINIFNSSCEYFNSAWNEGKRIYFKNKPEKIMHKSLKAYLDNNLRGAEVFHEFNLNSNKPVDLMIQWRTTNRRALIEVKWLGTSLGKTKKDTLRNYSKSRAIAGAEQLKNYLDFAATDSPGIITKGYLVVIDGRRKGISKKPIIKVISERNGLFYQDDEITYPDNYNETITNFEKPLRMFARPICQ